jgi:hypothetical protein
MIGEGMSCALHSGAISGEAIVEASRRDRPVQEIYRKMIASEVRRCTDQWNPLKIAFDRPHEADFPKALMKLSWRERKLVLRDMWNFVVLFKEFKWGRQIAAAALQRPLFAATRSSAGYRKHGMPAARLLRTLKAWLRRKPKLPCDLQAARTSSKPSMPVACRSIRGESTASRVRWGWRFRRRRRWKTRSSACARRLGAGWRISPCRMRRTRLREQENEHP